MGKRKSEIYIAYVNLFFFKQEINPMEPGYYLSFHVLNLFLDFKYYVYAI